jgi:hypothetical protein
MIAPHAPARFGRGLPVLILAGLLAACASSPSPNISRVPAVTAEQTSKEGLFLQPVKWTHTKPACQGECPKVELDSIVFPGVPRLTELIDVALATMTGVGQTVDRPYETVAEYEQYFWKTAAPRDSTLLAAKARYRNRDLTVVELNTWQYMTGAAHGISATQFLNWDNRTGKVLGLENVLLPGQTDAYTAALQRVHAEWVAQHPDARHDPATFRRLWPFQPSSNFAITDAGLVVKYDSYQIAPYSSGQPELLIPYSALEGILRPEFMPA